MARAPCCEKMGLKKGPWTPEEDQILVSFIRLHGHTNWRALPKKAGLLRCGKSCRLRWINYLRPDTKRGNFTQEEEETIFKLHEMLGNRWSAIAAELPGRTDNEIKNVWHTHLKKRLIPKHNQNGSAATLTVVGTTAKRARKSKKSEIALEADGRKEDNKNKVRASTSSIKCPQSCTSDEVSNITSTITSDIENVSAEINDDFWMEVFSVEDITMFTTPTNNLPCHLRISPDVVMADPTCVSDSDPKVHTEEMERFWFNYLLTRSIK